MIINVGFYKKENGKHINKNVTGIEVEDDLWEKEDGRELRETLMKHAPEGNNWSIQGYARVG